MEKLLSIHEGDSIGSILSLQIALKDDFLNFNESEILFRNGRDWKTIEFTDETGELRFSEIENDNGLIVAYQGTFALHGPIKEISKIMRPYLGRKSVLKIESFNKEIYIVGDPDNPVFITSIANTGAKVIERSQIAYSFSADTPLFNVDS